MGHFKLRGLWQAWHYSHTHDPFSKKKIWDTLIVCVDRPSGWIVAVPEKKVGLTGAKVALAMVKH